MSFPFKALAALSGAWLFALVTSARAAVVTASYSSAGSVPVTTASYTATGNTVNFTLNFAPVAGSTLTVVKNTGMAFIQGTFDNLQQGQKVNLLFGGISYPFVANYFGGTGNDLVLQWANTRIVTWGTNGSGQLGSPPRTNNKIPEAVDGTGVLSGKSILAAACGTYHSIALCSDGTLAAWGSNFNGQTGNNSTNSSEFVPVAVDRSGVLAGRTVIAIAAGDNHSLALCADGALVGWGSDNYDQLGLEGTSNIMTPVLIPARGVLIGRSVIAIAAGGNHSLALCSDGTLAAWGSNSNGQLGSISTSNLPKMVDQTGALAGKTVVAIAAGTGQSLALCSDGRVAAWGVMPGDGNTESSSLPVLVDMTGVLAGKTVTAIAAGTYFNLVLCADGTMAAWGQNYRGQLGDGWSDISASRPVLVKSAPVLVGRLVTAITAGDYHCLIRCSDGIAGSWGDNSNGQLGNDSTNQANVPVFVNTTGLRTGERFVAVTGGSGFSLGITASPPPPSVTTLAVSSITDTGATLNGTVNPNGQSTVVGFEYGLTTAYGSTASPTPATLTGTTAQTLAVTLTNLANRTTYHYRVLAINPGGTLYGEDITFTTSDIASLEGMSLSVGTLSPGFESSTTSYSAVVPYATSSITVTPVAGNAQATVRVQGVTVVSGEATAPVALAVGNTTITVVVTPQGAAFSKTYTVLVTRSPETYVFNSPTTVPVTAAAFDATGQTVAFSLGFTPPLGTTLTVVNNTGPDLIQGAFDNLTQGQQVELKYNGIAYQFLANYFGGTGNDLVLQWGNTRLMTWGANSSGQLGQNHTANGLFPSPVLVMGALTGKAVLSVSTSSSHCLALCADGSLVAWGNNSSGQLGDDSLINRSLPVAVDQSGVLAGKRVMAVSAGSAYSLALCDDGTLAAWGDNDFRQLGDGTSNNQKVPVLVKMDSGGFAGKKVSAMAAGVWHSLAQCTDGTLVAWGYGDSGQLGNGANPFTSPPVIVTKGTLLSGKSIVGLAAGHSHSMVLCSDGTLAAWGSNGWGQVGNNSSTESSVPVAVVTSGVLSGKTITGIAAGSSNSLARCSDSTLATWGQNTNGRLGNGSTTHSKVPVAVTRTGVLSGKTIVGASPWAAVCSDGTVATWGDNTYGQLGNNSTTHSTTPVLAITTALRSGEKMVSVQSSGGFNLAVVASPPAPTGTTLAATGVGDRTCTMNGIANANGQSATVSFQYGLTASYGWSVAGTPSPVTGTAPVAVSAVLTGLLPGKTYHYRVVVSSGGGIAYGGDQVFTTTTQATLAGLVPSVGTLVPTLDPAVSSYSMSVLSTTSNITLAPIVAQPGATVTAAGTPVISGTASGPLALAVGNTMIPVVVTAADGVTTMTYTVTVTRPPEVLAFNAAADVPVTAAAFDATGMTATFALGFAPPPGTVLTVVNQTGLEFIRGAFGNLAQGQEVELAYAGLRYRFIVNYFGGTGNDLVLQWANVRLMAWGSNNSGQIGNGGQIWNGTAYVNNYSLVPTAVDVSGVLAGKTVMASAVGGSSSLALCSDGTLATWGVVGGKLSNGTDATAVVPVLVDRSGVLSDKTVVALAVGSQHRLVLCADGTVAAWGDNSSGQLGNNSTTASTVPVLVDTTGVLAGRKVVKIAATASHNLALCGDGTLVAWGKNGSIGQLGNNSTIDSSVPVLVETGGVLYGRRVVEIAAGGGHSAALCADGTLAVWGQNYYGQLGLGNKMETKVPVALPLTGVLAGKVIRSVSANFHHTMVSCTDGTLAAWGYNASGRLGNNSTTDSMVPVAVIQSGVLSRRTVTRIATGWAGGGALCSDGNMATWGSNDAGQLGNNSTSTSSSVPVLVDMTGLRAGERFVQGQMNWINSHTLALVGAVPEPSAVLTLAATATHDKGTTLNGSVNANGSATTVTFEYGLTTAYGTVVSAFPATVTGTTATPVSAVLAGLPTGTPFHYRVVASSVGGVVKGQDLLVTTTDQATLAGLAVSAGTLDPGFAPETTAYAVTVPAATATLTITPVASHADAVITVNGRVVASGAASEPVALAEGNNAITVGVTSGAGTDTGTYTLRVLRVPSLFRFTAADSVGIAVSSLRSAGAEARFELGFAPLPGCVLTVVDNTGPAMIDGVFDNLAHGQRVDLSFDGAIYPFVANYYGGTGNDLVLQWAATKLFSWGYDYSGELGDNSAGSGSSQLPVPVYTAGVLAGKTVMAVSVGGSTAAALCADGTVASWGYGYYGRLGNGVDFMSSGAPVAVTLTGGLAGKKVVAIAVGGSNTLALCADGTLATWGENASGQLGDNTTTHRPTPVLVDRSGVLKGKAVTAIACGQNHSLVLCADGTLAAWGASSRGQLGSGFTAHANVPVAVSMTGVLAGKTVTAITAGDSVSFALCSDGSVAAWGKGDVGQLGNGATSNSFVPVLVDRTGVLAGKTVTGVAAGSSFGVARCADGTLAAWGTGNLLGAGAIANSTVPVLVNRTGVLAGKIATSLAAGNSHTLVGCSDGSAAAWGSDSNGQLGDSTAGSSVTAPVAVATSTLPAGSRFMTVNDGCGNGNSVAMVALPPPPAAATLAATQVMDVGATLNASVQPSGVSTAVSFEYGATTAYGTTVQASPATVTGTGSQSASYVLGGLTPGATYHFRVVVVNPGGTFTGGDMTFTTTTLGTLAGLTLDPGSVFPAFESIRSGYTVTVPRTTDSMRVTPVTAHADAAVTVNGVATPSGTSSAPIALAQGNSTISVVVNSGDGINIRTYQIVVTRLPETFDWPSAAMVPVTATDFLAVGNAPPLSLGHAVETGASLMVVNNTGAGPIRGSFGNLADGQRVTLEYGGITYPFVVNYAGGTGNDLVLEWGNTRLMTWGLNSQGQLGDGTLANALVPKVVPWSGGVAGKSIREIRVGFKHSLALTWDGSLIVWGSTAWGSDGSGVASSPALLPNPGPLLGKRVVSIAVGDRHNLALCSDGTLASWGHNYRGQLGDNSYMTRNTPVLVDRTGVIKDKQIVNIEAGRDFSVALCSDGTVVQWGWLSGSQFPSENSLVPVSMQDRGALVGKKVIKLRAGFDNWLALCSDGTLVAWGANGSSQFGNGTTGQSDNRYAPAAVTMSGELAGKTIVEMALSSGSCLVLCSDGTLVSWGSNYYGQLGIGNQTNSKVPVKVNQTGVLGGKTVVKVFAGLAQSYALCRDGSMAAWGYNHDGSLGNGTTTDQTVPVLVSRTNFTPGESFAWSGGPGSACNHGVAITALPPPTATSLDATGVSDVAATLNGTVNARENAATVSFEYGLDQNYGQTIVAAPPSVTGHEDTSVSAAINGLLPGTIYHYRVVATSAGGVARGADRSFLTLSGNARLGSLVLSSGALAPGFDAGIMDYVVSVPFTTGSVRVTPVVAHSKATVQVNGVPVASGTASAPIPLAVGNTSILVRVTADDGITTRTNTVTVTRLPQEFVFHSASDIPVSANGFSAGGYQVTPVLQYAPTPGTVLTLVNNTGLGFIHGVFGNLAQGQHVTLTFGGKEYDFLANYFGGSGNDLVLQWAATKVLAWGLNSYGQVGDASTTGRLVPTRVNDAGVLSGKILTAVSAGYLHSLALCSDGTIAAWGYNVHGQLGNGSSAPSSVPVEVDRWGALAGKTVIAVSAGSYHNLALCSDGTVTAWGYNNYGQLGNARTETGRVPVLVNRVGALAGKHVVAVAAAAYQSFALCDDGTVAGWGYNDEGELGDGTTTTAMIPVAVSVTGALSGKRIATISAGQYHTLALCTDGTPVSWGYNNRGQLGNGTTTTSGLPVNIGSKGVLAGRTVVSISAGNTHSLALCDDGTLASWGDNQRGQLGTGSTTQSLLPVAADRSGFAPGVPVAGLAARSNHGLMRFADGTLAAWGDNANGQLGDGGITQHKVPGAVNFSSLPANARFIMTLANGAAASHCLAVVALPELDAATRGIWSPSLRSNALVGEVDLLRHAFGIAPGEDMSGKLPQPGWIGGRFEVSFSEPAGISGIVYGAEWSGTLLPGSWIAVPDSGSGTRHVFTLPTDAGNKVFMRLKVTKP